MIPDHDSNILNNISKLKWACRRGMLELDVLLGNFVSEAYAGLTIEDKNLFIEFLTFSDPELFAWLLGSKTPTDPRIAYMVDRIRNHAQSRFQS